MGYIKIYCYTQVTKEFFFVTTFGNQRDKKKKNTLYFPISLKYRETKAASLQTKQDLPKTREFKGEGGWRLHLPVVPPPGWESAEMIPGYLRHRKSNPYR